MCPQVADPGEPLPTLVTAEGFLPGVHPLVLLQVAGLREALPAEVAAEGFLPRVDPLVGLQIGEAGKSLPARSAHVAPPTALAGRVAVGQAIVVASQKAGAVACGNSHLNAGQRRRGSPERRSPRGAQGLTA